MLQLGSQALVECHGASFRTVVIDDRGYCHVGGHTGDGNYVAVVLVDHGWQKFLHCQEVRDGVDFERPANGVYRFVKNSHSIDHSCIVNKDRGVAMGVADLSADRGEGVGRRDISLIEVNTGLNCVNVLELNWSFRQNKLTVGFLWRVQIQADNLDASLSKIQGHQLSDSTGPASYQDNFLAIDPSGILLPVVNCILRELVVEEAHDVKAKEDFQPLEKPCGGNPGVEPFGNDRIELMGVVEKGKQERQLESEVGKCQLNGRRQNPQGV